MRIFEVKMRSWGIWLYAETRTHFACLRVYMARQMAISPYKRRKNVFHALVTEIIAVNWHVTFFPGQKWLTWSYLSNNLRETAGFSGNDDAGW